MKVTEQVAAFAEPVVREQGCSLWDVEYVREGDKISFKITIPGDTQAKLVFGGEETFLYSGENVVSKKL